MNTETTKETIYKSEYDALEAYDEMLDECYPQVDICGYKYAPSNALKKSTLSLTGVASTTGYHQKT